MEFQKKNIILAIYLFLLLAGTLFCIPNIFVNRFTTATALWMQAGISVWLLGYVFFKKRQFAIPPRSFILVMVVCAIYHLWRSNWNFESCAATITLISAFCLFYAVWSGVQDKKPVFYLFTALAVMLSLWGLAQYVGWLPVYHGSLTVTGPFDNPAGISASLVLLLPFPLYCIGNLSGKWRLVGIIASGLVVTTILLSGARAAILAVAATLSIFFIVLLKKRGIKLSAVHYGVAILGCLLLFAGLFFIKKDSANGRLLIWRCTGQLIARKPILGYGGNGFTANYMDEQAAYFNGHPDSKYTMLADNVRHTFNEFLKWTVNYGIAGLILTSFLVAIPLYHVRKEQSTELTVFRISLLSIAVCALFSYPLDYPFVRLMAIILLAFIAASVPQKKTKVANNYRIKGVAVLLSSGILAATCYEAFYEREWHIVAHKSLRGKQ